MLLIFIIAIVVGVVIYALYPSSTTTQHTTQIVNGIANVNAKTYVDYPFTVPSDASNISVSGTFTAHNGVGNDIKVFILDSTNFDNYAHVNGFTSLYQSGQIITDSFNVSLLSSGNYHLVLDNQFSAITQKTVDIEATVNYLK